MSGKNNQEGDKINATVRMSATDWEALAHKARAVGLTRTKLLTQIARGEIQLDKIVLKSEKQLLGESSAS